MTRDEMNGNQKSIAFSGSNETDSSGGVVGALDGVEEPS